MTETNIVLKRGARVELTITDMAFGGKGIAKVPTPDGEFVLFVPNTIPGQVVKAQIIKKRKRHGECKLMEVLQPSAQEVANSYQPIPGAPYARLPIALQEDYKRNTTFQLFKRIGGIENTEGLFDEFISSPSCWHYRNKMEYSFSSIRYDLNTNEELDEFGLGFKHRGTWWMVENLDADSGMFDEMVENNLYHIRQFCEATGLPAWHPPRKEGFFRYLVVRKSYHTNELLFDFVTSSAGLEQFDTEGFVAQMKALFGERLAGILHSINDDIGDRARPSSGDGSSTLIYGNDKIVERLLHLDFEISMQSFFQTNPKSAEKLYQKVIDYALEANLDGQVVMDLFCGTGTIGQILASRANNIQIIGVDIVEDAIVDARQNALRNHVEGIEFYAADVNKFLYEYPEYRGKIGTIVLDPPRAGIAPKALRRVIELEAPRIVYVSCNPATQARDAETLCEAGYVFKKFSLIDQFPHTSHIESIALFEKPTTT